MIALSRIRAIATDDQTTAAEVTIYDQAELAPVALINTSSRVKASIAATTRQAAAQIGPRAEFAPHSRQRLSGLGGQSDTPLGKVQAAVTQLCHRDGNFLGAVMARVVLFRPAQHLKTQSGQHPPARGCHLLVHQR